MNMICNVIQFQPRFATPVDTVLRRPKLLVTAAWHAQQNWSRERDLRRVLKTEDLPKAAALQAHLRADEAQLEAARKNGAAAYDPHRHILLLAAILHEDRAESETCLNAPGTGIPAHL